MRRQIDLPPFQNVGAGNTVFLPNIPQGYVYDAICLELGGTFTKAQITDAKLKLGGKLIWEFDGSELDTINAFMGRTAASTILEIPFADPNADDPIGQRIGALDTKTLGYSSFSLELKIAGAATSPTLAAFGLLGSDKVPEHVPLFRSMLKSTDTIGGAGTFNLTPAVGAGTRLARLHLFHSNITELNVRQRSQDVVSGGTIARLQYVQERLTRAAQSGHLAYDAIVNDRWRNMLPLFDDNGRPIPTEFRATFSGSDTIEMLSEVIGTYGAV